MKILLPTTLPLSPDLPSNVTAINYDIDTPIPAEHEDAEVLVVWGNSDDHLRDSAARLKQLRWVQTLAAGPDQVVAAGFSDNIVITSGRSMHSATVAEHALALTLAAARSLHTLVRAQLGHRWAAELGGRQPAFDPNAFTTLRGARVSIWGFGSIAETLAPMLSTLGAEVTGVARSAGERHGVTVIAGSDIDTLLPTTDVLIMILPGGPGTDTIMNASRLALLPGHAWLINVGRGVTVDEPALIESLRTRSIGGAALDVTRVEPLPISSPLWDLPNVILTPHSAGGRPLGADELISSNVAALLSGTELINIVAR
jgi:phosphoglycerate dehydrogenase-like enzyme